MADTTTILGDIETAIEQRLRARGLAVREFDIADEPETIVCPAANIAFSGGRCRRITDKVYRVEAIFSIILVVQNVKDERSRRHGIYPLVIGVMNSIANADLTITDETSERALPVRMLIPGQIRRVLATKSRIGYQIDVPAHFTQTLTDADGSGELITLALQYYLQPDDDVLDAQDTVELT